MENEIVISKILLNQLIEMGISENKAKRALYFAGDSIETALEWAFTNNDVKHELPLSLEEITLYKQQSILNNIDENKISNNNNNNNNNDDDDDERYKMVIVVRTDLGMSTGKIAAQCSHAAVGAYEMALTKFPHLVEKWNISRRKKVVLRIENEVEMLALRQQAQLLGNIPYNLVRDAGKTEVAPNTATVCAFGPASESQINAITGSLKLLK